MRTPEEELELLRLKRLYLLKKAEQVSEGPGNRGGWELPPDFLDIVIGYDKIKRLIVQILRTGTFGENIMLIGPPGSGKSLIFSEVSQLEGVYYASGSSTSGAGLTTILFERQPRIVIVDEADKIKSEDLSILLHLAQTGVVQETKVRHKGQTGRSMRLDPLIFAGANDERKLAPEFRNRFIGRGFRLQPYTESEFHLIVKSLLRKRYGTSEYICQIIAGESWVFGKSVREAERAARLCSTEEEVKDYFDTLRQHT